MNIKAQKFWQPASCFLTVLAWLIFTTGARGEGFRNPPAGAFDLGRAGGRAAQVDDASAVQQNPANMTDLTNIQVQATPSIVYIKVNYSSSTAPGQTAETQSPWKLLPNLFAVVPFANGNAAAGLGITVPYGLSMEWNQNSSAFTAATPTWRYLGAGGTPYFAALTTANINPAVAVKLGEHFSLGAGLDVMWSSLQFKTYIAPVPGGDPADAYGTGAGVGGNIALTWKITDRQRLALTFRSPMTVNYYGTFSQALAPTKSDFRTEIRYPTIVSAGYGVDLPYNVRLESDVEWLQFSRF
ncbi:MAG TPA: outer membrane protein transport protein, partial [Verrucomicrobiae bacterium]|nr:outer membrane protein transport protein [Verrucomicrobiae bacterium]